MKNNNKNLWTGFHGLCLFLLVLSFLLFGAKVARAADIAFYNNSGGTANDWCDSSLFGETFQATQNNVSKASVYIYPLDQNGTDIYFHICEVSALNQYYDNANCIGSEYSELAGTISQASPSWSARFWTVNLSVLFPTTVGHYYKTSWTVGRATSPYYSIERPYFQSGNPISGANGFYDNNTCGSGDIIGDIFYDDTYSAEYCGDTICQTGTENCSTCPADCSACSYVGLTPLGWPNAWDIPIIFGTAETKQFRVAWNVCADYDNVNSVKITMNLTGDSIDRPVWVVQPKDTFIGAQQCQGIATIYDYFSNYTATGTASFLMTEYFTNTDYQILSDSIDWISTSTLNYISSANPDPLFIDLGNLSTSTTSLFYSYNFNTLNTASSSVCLWDYSNATSTGYCDTRAFNATSTGIGYITIPNPTIETSKRYQFYSVIPGVSTIKSRVFSVIWWYSPAPAYVCEPPVFDFTHTCDGIDTSGDFCGLGCMLCAMKKSTIITGVTFFTPSCDSLGYFTTNYNAFKKSFPFNTFYQLTDSIQTAINTATSSTSTPQNFSIPFIHKASTTFYMLPVMSSSTMTNAIGASNTSLFRTTMSALMWLFAAVIIYFTVRKV